MAKFGIQYADKPVNVQSTGAYAQPQTQVYEAIAQAGQGIFQIGAELQQQQDALDYSKGQRQIEEKAAAARGSLTGDEDTDKQILDKLQQDISGVQIGSGRVNRALEIYRNRAMPDIQASLDKQHKALLNRNLTDEFDAEGQTRLAKGDLEGYQDILDRRLASKNISRAEYDSLSKSAFSDSLIEQTRDLIASNDGASQKLAMNMLDTIPNMAAIDLTTEQKEYLNKLRSVAKRKNNVISEEANKQLTDLMIGGTLSTEDVQLRRSELDDEDYQQWAKIALEPLDKRGNVVEMVRLKTLAVDVWRGTLSREDVEKDIRKSLTDPQGINDKQYAAIYEDLNREVKAYQAQDIKTYSIEATRLILGKDAGVMSFDALGNMSIDMTKVLSPTADFEKKMHYIDLYNKSMMDYLAANPAATKKEIYVQSQELKATYLKASKNEKPEPVGVVRISTDDEWLELEPGQKFIGPDGIPRTK